MSSEKYLSNTKTFLIEKGFSSSIEALVILGSGLGDFTDYVENRISIPYSSIPGFPETTVEGHSGELIFGDIAGYRIIAFSGRFHTYEGHATQKTVLPVHIAKLFQANKIIISNAAGAINTSFKVGDLMVINNISRLFQKVSAEPSKPFRYHHYPVADKVIDIASDISLNVQKGNYLFLRGPNYETKAEIKAFRKLGIDVVGMSTVPELVEASKLKIPAAAISLVTNMAAGVLDRKLDHSEVKAAAENRKDDFAKLVIELIKKL